MAVNKDNEPVGPVGKYYQECKTYLIVGFARANSVIYTQNSEAQIWQILKEKFGYRIAKVEITIKDI